ncbi:MAG: DUF2029 domain-containing protein [Chitinophagaceae bacterium]|nr:MAG: DUF2029 domain-containing protein [Chitinophagaceae bacterium]
MLRIQNQKDEMDLQQNIVDQWRAFTSLQKLFLFFLGMLLIAGMIKSIYYTSSFGGADLRERVVGARVLNTGQSPYYYKWQPGDPEELINPNLNRNRNISGLSVSPGTLYILYFFSPLKYPVLRFVWLVFQYVLLLYVLFYFLKQKTDQHSKLFLSTIGVVFFCSSPFWLLHIDRGQVYILYALFFCLIYQFIKSPKSICQFSAGLVLALAIYCRPTFAVAILPVFFCFRKTVFWGLLTGVSIALIGLIWNVQLWKDYLSAMSAFTQMTNNFQTTQADPVVYPSVIEGLTNLQKGKLDFMCGGIAPLDVWMNRFGIWLPGKVYVMIYGIVIFLLVYFFQRKLRSADAVIFTLFGFLCYMLSEYIMPAPRGAYTLIQWIIPVFVMTVAGNLRLVDKFVLVVGLCFTVAFPFYFPNFYEIGELMLVYTVLNYLRRYNVEVELFTSGNQVYKASF